MVSVSLRAGKPQLGQSVLRNDGDVSIGFPSPVNVTSSGNKTGSSDSGTGTTPQLSQ